ncbi:DegT/DnrJ/EryC1/StrS aminotransferase [Candidatus Sulfobium mesophilum]|uniref:GDP-perosamine synthase n=1 Tax=Candidatus Sulfobium mesophilum TaxID=2016548 RepID=A0A2U3QF13_9BACT|nr:DegT/DnrJ/EryC1/StrS aminotransferase [Candidatus Sulfobium mesophilum]
MNIPIARPFLGREEEEAAVAAIRSGWVSQGPKVKEFEETFAKYVGARYAVATTSCTTALHAALAVSGVGPGDEVVVPSLSFIATANAVVHAGAKPVFADIDPDTCNVTVETIAKVVTPRTKVVMPVHQMGFPVDLDPIIDFCKKKKLALIEDAACAIGSEYKGKSIGGYGNLACFSFHPRKVITTGEGGMITTDDSAIAEKLRRFRHHGMSVSDIERHTSKEVVIETYPEIGYNYRMTDIQAAIGLIQLAKLSRIIRRRREIAAFYDNALSRSPHIKVPVVPEYAYHNYQSYWVEVLGSSPVSRDVLMQKLLDKGIATRRGIMAIHLERFYYYVGCVLPATEAITRSTVLIPIYPAMKEDETAYVIRSIKEILQ